ncbi:hypothetical protein B0H16DRAFT_476240 [Mycena metata]|uniref:Uncharacterized protein n=1 Tax=Mycena metata TaxID=1033252 RepID=A0AAD7P0V6_9AGAR|nr:hypothetical protein B0H16DRAFT_476240 [Mycena metata]
MSDYERDYNRHLTQLKAHLSGHIGPSLPSSFVPPAGYWTSGEKALFFHALAVHSRLRPDLIADAVKSKTTLDVCAYLDALERAAAAAGQPLLRSNLECAMEVSEAWVDYEEEQATALVELEAKRAEEIEAHRRVEVLASRFQDDPAYWSWKDEQQRLWKQQDTLTQLDDSGLQMLTKLARDGDSGTPPPPSPESRRRMLNKIQMREKRAKAGGWRPDLDPSADWQTRQGQETRRTLETRRNAGSKKESDADDGATRLATGVQHALEGQGITAATLTESGVDVFNLVGLSKLMTAYSEDTAVSFTTLNALREILVEFATTVVHQAISMREQELFLKRKISVWRLVDENQITVQNVKDALEMHGFNTRNLLTEDDDEEVDDAERSQPKAIALHRELAPPFVRAEESDTELSGEMDVDGLAAELEDEDELEELDGKAEAVYEEELWQGVE